MPSPQDILEKYRDAFIRKELESAGLTIEQLESNPDLRDDVAKMLDTPEIQKEFKEYSANMARASVNNPTLEQYRGMSPTERASYVSRKTGKPFSTPNLLDDPKGWFEGGTLESVMSRPASTESRIFGGNPLQVLGAGVGDYATGGGRFLSALLDNDYLGMAETEETEGNLLQKMMRSPSLPLSPMASQSVIGMAPKVLPRIIGGGLTQGGVETAFDATRPEGVTAGEATTNMLGGMLGEGIGVGLGKFAKNIRERMIDMNIPSDHAEEIARYMSKGENRQAVLKELGREEEIAEGLTRHLFNNQKPENAVIKNALENMPPIETKPILQKMIEAIPKSVKGGSSTKDFDKAVQEAKDRVIYMIKNVDKTYENSGGRLMSPEGVKRLRQMLDAKTDFTGKADSDLMKTIVNDMQKAGRSEIRASLLRSAEKSGDPVMYKRAMEDLSSKLEVEGKLKGYLGQIERTAEKRGHSFINNTFGELKSDARKALKEYDKLNGTNFFDRAKNAYRGRVSGLRPDNTFKATSGYSTGRSLEGNKFGGPDVAINIGVPVLDALQTGAE